MEKLECALVDREGLVVSYLAGTLSADEAETFEAHYFGCDQCWRELQQGLEIRAALAPMKMDTPMTRPLPWRWIAAAAAVVLVASVWRWTGTPAPLSEGPATPPPAAPPSTAPNPVTAPPIPTAPPGQRAAATPNPGRANDERALRSTSSNDLRPVANRDANGEIRIEWPPVDKAVRYILTIFATNGSPLFRREIATPSIVIDAATAFPGHVNESLRARVDANNALGVTVASSPLFTIPARREEVPR